MLTWDIFIGPHGVQMKPCSGATMGHSGVAPKLDFSINGTSLAYAQDDISDKYGSGVI